MTDEQQQEYLERILSRLDTIERNQQELRRAVFGDEATRSKPLREEMLDMDAKVDEIITWVDRVKWMAAALGTTNVGALILGWLGIRT